jgi:hypothetical protein
VKIKLDENLPERLVAKLQSLGHDVDTVRAGHLAGKDDNGVWQAAQAAVPNHAGPGFLRCAPIHAWDAWRVAIGASRTARSGSLGHARCRYALCDRTRRAVEAA